MEKGPSRKIDPIYGENPIFHPEFKARRTLKIREILIIILAFITPYAILIVGGRYGYLELASTIFIILIIIFWIFIILTGIVPLLWMLFKFAYRTKNWNFIFQFIVYTQLYTFFFVISALSLLLLLNMINSDVFTVLNLIVVLSSLPLVVEFRFIRQPLLLNDADVSRNVSETKSTIISLSALEIESIEDGYSQRALFLEVNALANLVTSLKDFRSRVIDYASFLGKKGVIIDWKITDNSIRLFPRFLVPRGRSLTDCWGMWQLLNNVRKLKNLTELEITYSPPQISIQVAPNDYEMLAREVTFHFLGLNVLNRVGQSLIAFLNDDREAAYNLLF